MTHARVFMNAQHCLQTLLSCIHRHISTCERSGFAYGPGKGSVSPCRCQLTQNQAGSACVVLTTRWCQPRHGGEQVIDNIALSRITAKQSKPHEPPHLLWKQSNSYLWRGLFKYCYVSFIKCCTCKQSFKRPPNPSLTRVCLFYWYVTFIFNIQSFLH